MARLLAILLPLALALTGCVGLPGQDEHPAQVHAAGLVDAPSLAPIARDVARAWHADAALVLVTASEGLHADPEDPPVLYDTRADDDVGDGLALEWTYIYGSASAARAYVVTVTKDGTTVYAHEMPREGAVSPYEGVRELPPLPDVVPSSALAAGALRANSTAQSFVETHPVSSVRWTLSSTGENGAAQWIHARNTAAGHALWAIVSTDGVLKQVQSSDERWIPGCMDCPVPVPGPMPVPPGQPSPPPTPPDESTSKTSTLNAFNPTATMQVMPQETGWLYELTVTADVAGTSPVEDRTLHLYDASGMELAHAVGTGRLVVRATSNDSAPYGMWRAMIDSTTPIAKDQTVVFHAVVHYTGYDGYRYHGYFGGGGTVSYQQIDDRAVQVPRSDNVTMRVIFQANGPPTASPPDAEPTTWQLLDANGKEIGHGSAPSGTISFASAAFQALTLRVTGGTDALFGTSYRFSLSASYPQMDARPL